MKKIKKVEEVTTFVYEAVDGYVFDTAEECTKYENSAVGVLRGRFNKLIVGRYDAWEFMGGSEDHDILVLSIKTQKDADTVLQFYYLMSPWILNGNDTLKDKYDNMVNSAIGGYLLIGKIPDGDGIYLVNTADKIISNIKEACK